MESAYIINVKPVGYFVEGKGDQDTCRPNYNDIKLESWSTRGRTVKVYCWSGQLKANCFWSLWTGMEGNVFAKSIAANQEPGDVLICSSNETTSGRATTSNHQFMIIHCHLPRSVCLLPRQNGGWMEMWESPPLHLSSPWWWRWSLQSLQGCGIAFHLPFS